MKSPDLSPHASWKARYRTNRIAWFALATANPDYGLACSNQTGVLQLYGWHLPTGQLTQLTHRPNGVSTGSIAANGRFVYYLHDAQGNELGHFMRVPITGGEPEDITPNMSPYSSWQCGENHAGTTLGFAAVGGEGFDFFLLDQTPDGRLHTPRLLWHSTALSFGPVLSCSGDIAVVTTTERTGKPEYSLIAFDGRSGETLAELYDENASLNLGQFAPLPSDGRFLTSTNRSGFTRPLIWNPHTGERQDLDLPDLPGEIYPWDWSPDGQQLLLCQLHQACYQLYTYHLPTDTLYPLNHPGGTFSGGAFRPNGEIFTSWQDATHPPAVLALDGAAGVVKETALSVGQVLPGRPWRSVTLPSTAGEMIQAWVAVPEGEGPFPTILHTHGGPTAVMTETFHAESQSWLDHGFAFLSINYHGSTTFGKAYEEAIWGNLGNAEIDDMVAARDWAIASGIAQSDAILLTGGSYGGYLTLQALGRYPKLWAGGMAGIAIADWTLMYEDQAETLRGYQRALFGGTPEEKPQEHRRASPITYADDIAAPILVIQGSNDTRCPARQMQAYEAKLQSLGKPIQVHWFDAGHGSYDNEQQIEHQELKLCFAYRVLG